MAKKLKANAVSGYSNDSNPFGDPNLTEKYVNSFPSRTKLCRNSVILATWRKDFGSNLPSLSGEKKTTPKQLITTQGELGSRTYFMLE